MNTIYRLANALVAVCFASVCGFAIYREVPALFQTLDQLVISATSVVGLVGILVVGFLTLESRKI